MRNRGISFEEVLGAISTALLDVRVNPSTKHPQQKTFIVKIHDYPWVVPFKENEREIELITAFPDRRLFKEFPR
ncbi:MAG: toxin [Bradymonadales bacterium]|nr:MAG: toxin [Bradymonadales bacterium]